jgi:Ca2+-dependent lipid-binding protein
MNNLNPVWAPFSKSVSEICNGDTSRKMILKCYDWDSDGKNDLIGCSKETCKVLDSHHCAAPPCYWDSRCC